jgi:hypothetical protein
MVSADYERLRTLIKGCFPDPASPLSAVTDPMVDNFVQASWTNPAFTPDQRAQIGIPPPPAGWSAPPSVGAVAADAKVLGYYTAEATHSRTRNGQPWDSFIGRLPLVRVRLAQSDRSQIVTAIGVVDDTTSLYRTVDEFNARLAGESNFRPASTVHLITPPRMAGERFAAVSAYLSYSDPADTSPQAYLLEAGLAQGGPRVPFYGSTMDTTIVKQTNYEPTPFSRTSHWYRGDLAVTGNEPARLHIDVFVDQALTQQYMAVDVRFVRETAQSVSKINPLFLRAEAALRVIAVAESIGLNVGAPDFVQTILATVARALPWVQPPW